jgi:hypothetical protein
MQKDAEDYILIEDNFEFKGYNFSLVKTLADGWKIYKKSKEGSFDKFELVKPRKQKERNFKGKVIPKKWKYPSDEDFGSYGFDCISLERALSIYKKIRENKEEKESKEESSSKIRPPESPFTCQDIIKKNKNLNYSDAYCLLKEWLSNKIIVKIGERKNKKGKASILYAKK